MEKVNTNMDRSVKENTVILKNGNLISHKMSYSEQVSDYFKYIRMTHNLTQGDLSDKMNRVLSLHPKKGYNKQKIYNIEAGNTVNARFLSDLAIVFGFDVNVELLKK